MVTDQPIASYVTVGVTGHIDHGKTTLVRTLTGVDTDSHPEEKRRGITIDIGFAALVEDEHTFAFIDAPGHQKYIGNLLSGVSAVDIGLLVVACDQGIQQQTLEHAAVLKTLGVPRLIVALTRVDLADELRHAEVVEELEVFLADYGFDEIPIHAVSSVSGAGIEDLKLALRHAANSTQAGQTDNRWKTDANFRMPIDRVLKVTGRGLVLAGTVWSGRVRVGDPIQIAGQAETLRVREVEVHGAMVTESARGKRTAINVTGHAGAEVRRGDELVACGSHLPTQCILAEVTVHRESPDVSCPATMQLHTATTTVEAKLSGVKLLPSGATTVVVIETASPIVATFHQAFLLRRPYPIGTLGGGRVLGTVTRAGRKTKELLGIALTLALAQSPRERLKAWCEFYGEWRPDRNWFESQLAIALDESQVLVDEVLQVSEVQDIGGALVSASLLKRVSHALDKVLQARAADNDDAWIVESALLQRVSNLASPAVGRHALKTLVADKRVVELNGMYAVASEKTQLSKKQRVAMQRLLALYEGSRSPPTLKELTAELDVSVDVVKSLVRHASHQRIVVELGQGLWISTVVIETLAKELQQLFHDSGPQSVSAIKDQWGVSRKFAIPLLEYFDREQLTVREQDLRAAGPTLGKFPANQK